MLAALQPNPWWRYSTLLQRTTILALSGSRSAAAASMEQAVQVGTGHVEPVVVLGCEALHQLMLFDLYGYATPGPQEIHQITMEMLKDVPSPVFQVQKGFGAQLFGDQSTVAGSVAPLRVPARTVDQIDDRRPPAEGLRRHGRPRRLPRPTPCLPTGPCCHTPGCSTSPAGTARACRSTMCSVAWPRSTATCRPRSSHARDAVALARSMPSPPLLVHCLDHLADALERAGDGGHRR